ncbi:hypothetical protein EN794_000035 [Mesorhizobium sp. M00.F.Ca.ET.151.01.1.1]|nr:hypothetical protein EN794_000035 [Mesorhizobium sp. M00.F.Ca.ET.151.01.1.1]
MSSTISTEIVRTATPRDLLVTLAVFNPLPRRSSGNPELEFASFQTALEGREPGKIVVGYTDLVSAARAIMQGALGHGFHPSPVELRMWCDACRDQRLEEIAKADRRRAADNEQAAYRSTGTKSEQGRERVAAAYALFCEANAQAHLEVATKNYHRPRPAKPSAGPPDPKTVCGTAKPDPAPV